MIFKYLYQFASAHTHCLITFLKNIRSSERGAYSIDSRPIVNSKKRNNLIIFLRGFRWKFSASTSLLGARILQTGARLSTIICDYFDLFYGWLFFRH